MLPVRLEIRNFLAYRSPDPVYFDGVHLACLTGANGAGKTSLLDAITWALWGKARTRRDEDLIHMGQSDMYVLLEFEQGGVHYQVVRRRARGRSAGGALDLFAIGADGTLNNLSEGSMRETQAAIDRLLNLDYDTFVHSAFLQQGKADAFSTKTPKERKQILSDILALDRWAGYEDAVREKTRKIEEEINGIEHVIRLLDAEIAQEPARKLELERAETAQRDAEERLQAADAALRKIEDSEDKLRAKQRERANQERVLKDYAADQRTVEAEIKRLEVRIAEQQAVIAQRDQIEKGYAALQTAREDDSALAGKLMQINDLDQRRAALVAEVEAARAALDAEIKAFEAQIGEKQKIIDNAKPEKLTALQVELERLDALDAERDALQAQKSQLEQERASIETTNKSLRIEMDDLKDRLNRLNSADGAICPVCGQPLEGDARDHLLEELLAEGTQRGDTYRANQTRMTEIAALIKTNEDQIVEIRVRQQRAGDLRQQAGELQAGVDASNDAKLELTQLEAQRDAVQARLDAEDYAHELRAEIATLDEERAALGYDKDQHSTVRRDLQTYKEFEAQHTKLANALENLPETEQRLEMEAARRDRLSKAMEETQAQIDAIDIEIAGLVELVKEAQQRRAEVNRLHQLAQDANTALSDARQALKAIDVGRARKADCESTRADLRVELALHAELREAFGQKGVPAMIIDAALPELEAAANRLLNRMTDGRMSVMINTQREKITGGVLETLDIQIADELGTRSYDLYSGGEAFRIDFALRVALSQMLARRAGAQLRTLFIDEGFGTQDDEGRDKLVEAITAIQDDFDMILVITHIEELRDSFPVHIAVEKTSSGSRIAVR